MAEVDAAPAPRPLQSTLLWKMAFHHLQMSTCAQTHMRKYTKENEPLNKNKAMREKCLISYTSVYIYISAQLGIV